MCKSWQYFVNIFVPHPCKNFSTFNEVLMPKLALNDNLTKFHDQNPMKFRYFSQIRENALAFSRLFTRDPLFNSH